MEVASQHLVCIWCAGATLCGERRSSRNLSWGDLSPSHAVTSQEIGAVWFSQLLSCLVTLETTLFFKAENWNLLEMGVYAESEGLGPIDLLIRQEIFFPIESMNCIYSSDCWSHLLVIVLCHWVLCYLTGYQWRFFIYKICSDVPKQYIILWLIFCFVLFSLSVNSAAALCWFVLCVCFGSVSIPFHLTFLFLCFLHPIFQISLDERLFCKVHILTHICNSLVVNIWICTCLSWEMHHENSWPCVACMSAVPNMKQGSYYIPF